MPKIGESWRGADGFVWKVVAYNALGCSYVLETEGDARKIVTLAWFDAATHVQLRPFLRWWR